MTKPQTHGEAYASNHNGYRDKIHKKTTSPIHEAVNRLVAQGVSHEDAWMQIMQRVSPSR